MEDIRSEYFTRKELAAQFGVSERTVWRWENRPDGLAVAKVGGLRLISKIAVREFLARQETRRNPRRAA